MSHVSLQHDSIAHFHSNYESKVRAVVVGGQFQIKIDEDSGV